MRESNRYRCLLFVGLLPICGAAAAYVGPGAGLSLLGALWGLLAAVGAALLFLLLWPLRRMRNRRRRHETAESEARRDNDEHEPPTAREQRRPAHITGGDDAQ